MRQKTCVSAHTHTYWVNEFMGDLRQTSCSAQCTRSLSYIFAAPSSPPLLRSMSRCALCPTKIFYGMMEFARIVRDNKANLSFEKTCPRRMQSKITRIYEMRIELYMIYIPASIFNNFHNTNAALRWLKTIEFLGTKECLKLLWHIYLHWPYQNRW